MPCLVGTGGKDPCSRRAVAWFGSDIGSEGEGVGGQECHHQSNSAETLLLLAHWLVTLCPLLVCRGRCFGHFGSVLPLLVVV